VVILLILLTGCVTYTGVIQRGPVQSPLFPASKAKTYQVLIDLVTGYGWPIQSTDSFSGLLVAGPLKLTERINCGTYNGAGNTLRIADPTGTVQFLVLDGPDSGSTLVRITTFLSAITYSYNAVWDQWIPVEQVRCESYFQETIFAQIRDKLSQEGEQ